jgi:hypothetical protein
LLGIPGIMLARPEARDGRHPEHTVHRRRQGQRHRLAGHCANCARHFAGHGVFASFDTVMLSFLPLVAMEGGMSQSRALASASILLAGDAACSLASAGWPTTLAAPGTSAVRRWSACCCPAAMDDAATAAVGGYLFVLGACAGAIYTLSVASGELFSGAALLRVSGLISLSWNASSSLGPAATGLVMQHAGSAWMVAVLWAIALLFVLSGWRQHAAMPVAARH